VVDAKEIVALVERELSRIADDGWVRRIHQLLVSPHPVNRAWDYGEPHEQFTCWTVLEHNPSNTGIAFCSDGFGPAYPWGLVFLSGPHMHSMDSAWFTSLEDAVRNSMAWDGNNPEGYQVG
jgi:hypothetical protein